MTLLIMFVCAALVITKLLDVLSTLKNIRGIHHESNPVARALMYRWGIRNTVWAIFGLAVGLSITAGLIAYYSPLWMQWSFILYGTFVALVQAGVAHANYTHRQNILTKLASRLISEAGRLWGR